VINRQKRSDLSNEATIISAEEMDAIETAAIAGKPLQDVTEILKGLPVIGKLDVDNNVFTSLELDGNALLDKAAEQVTLDPYLDRSPKVGNPIDWDSLVRLLQKKRQMFIDAEDKKKSGKEEKED
jgi:hypothetical protein